MWWQARVFIACAALLLSACGFKPLYGQKSGGAESLPLAGVMVDPIPTRPGQQLRSDLEDRLNPSGAVPARPDYRLAASLSTSTGAIGVARDGTISRYNVYLTTNYTLYRVADNAPLTTGSARHVSAYNNVTNAYFSTHVSEADAIKQGVTELSEILRQRIAAFLASGAQPDIKLAPKTKAPAGP